MKVPVGFTSHLKRTDVLGGQWKMGERVDLSPTVTPTCEVALIF